MDLKIVQAYVAGYFRRSCCMKRVTVLSVEETSTSGQFKVKYEWEQFSDGDELGEIDTDVLYISPAELLGDFNYGE